MRIDGKSKAFETKDFRNVCGNVQKVVKSNYSKAICPPNTKTHFKWALV